MDYVCIQCGTKYEHKDKTKEVTRRPRSWKDHGQGPICDGCVKNGWTVRTLTLPVDYILYRNVRGPSGKPLTGPDGEVVNEEVRGFTRHFLPAWRQATDLTNWCRLALSQRDVRRLPDMHRLPEYKSIGLFNHWNTMTRGDDAAATARANRAGLLPPQPMRDLWIWCTGSAAAIMDQTERIWKTHKEQGRYAVIWKGSARPSRVTFPQPWIVRHEECDVALGHMRWIETKGEDGQTMRAPLVSINLPGPGPDGAIVPARYHLVLKVNGKLKRMLKDFDRIIKGEAIGLDVKLNAVMRGGKIQGAKVSIAGRFPRSALGNPAERVARVRTCENALFAVTTPDRDDWVLYATHLKGPLTAYSRWTKRLAEIQDAPDSPPRSETPAPDAMSYADVQRELARLASDVRRLRRGQASPDRARNPLTDLVREIRRYEAWMTRYREDLKYEKRWPGQKRRRFVDEAQARIDRHNRRMRSECQEMAAALVGFVDRQRCGKLEYDDQVRTMFPTWRWSDMRDRVKVLCDQRGIEFVYIEPPSDAKTKGRRRQPADNDDSSMVDESTSA